VQVRERAAAWYRVLTWLFARTEVRDAVTTRVRVEASPETVWDHLMFYEDVPGRPSFFLRALLPHPLRTHGDKTRLGTTVRCEYDRGDLVKRITAVDSPRWLRFEVTEQRLGIEDCVRTLGGSYQISRCGDATEVVLTTMYRAFLRPRFLWRPFEVFVATRLHGHILRGVSAAVRCRGTANRAETTAPLAASCTLFGPGQCQVSKSRSHR
jgi:hypothetical protein